jgi:hypothetical protein
MRSILWKHLGILVLLTAVLPVGCSIGPRRLAPARFDYNQAIARSSDQQLLLNLVRLRYRDTPVFLEMSTLLTQYTLTSSASIEPTIVVNGGDEIAPGAGLAFSETPTIGYTPLQGQDFAERILSPIPPESIVLLSHSGWSIERLLGLAVHEINGIQNAIRAAGPTPDTPPDFEEFQELSRELRELQIAGLLEARIDPDTGGGSRVWFAFRPAGAAGDQTRIDRVKALLGVSPDVDAFRIVSTAGSGAADEMVVRGRSLLGTMFFLSQGVEPPSEHLDAGKVTVTRTADGQVFDWEQVVGNLLAIHSSVSEPTDAFVAIRYRDHWFYIDDSDLNGKATFNLLNYLFSLQAASGRGASPLLTVPAGG